LTLSAASECLQVHLSTTKRLLSFAANAGRVRLVFCGHSNAGIEHSDWHWFLLLLLNNVVSARGWTALRLGGSGTRGFCIHLAAHEVVDEALTSVQVCPQVVAYLNESISLLRKSTNLQFLRSQLAFKLSNRNILPTLVRLRLVQLIKCAFDFLDDSLHVDLHLLNHALQSLVLFLKQLDL